MDSIPYLKEIKAVPSYVVNAEAFRISIQLDGEARRREGRSPPNKDFFETVRKDIAALLEEKAGLPPHNVTLIPPMKMVGKTFTLNINVPVHLYTAVTEVVDPLVEASHPAHKGRFRPAQTDESEQRAAPDVPDVKGRPKADKAPKKMTTHAGAVTPAAKTEEKPIPVADLVALVTDLLLNNKDVTPGIPDATSKALWEPVAKEAVAAAIAASKEAAAAAAGGVEVVEDQAKYTESDKHHVFCAAVDKVMEGRIKDADLRRRVVGHIAFRLSEKLLSNGAAMEL